MTSTVQNTDEKTSSKIKSKRPSSSSTKANSSTSPATTWAFIIGHCEEWPEDRTTLGDHFLFQCFANYTTTANQKRTVYVTNQHCRKQNCQKQLQRLLTLAQVQPNDTLVFYYGGHGSETGLKLIEEEWDYEEIIRQIEDQFLGNKVWMLLDCCYSGACVRYLPPPKNEKDPKQVAASKSYLCLMSTHGDTEASDLAWAITDPFTKAMVCNNSSLTTQDVIDIMCDHHTVYKGDWFQAVLYPATPDNVIDPILPFPFRIPTDNYDNRKNNMILVSIVDMARLFASSILDNTVVQERSPHHLPLNLGRPPNNKDQWKGLVGMKRGDSVFAKWHGGVPPVSSGSSKPSCYLCPMYYSATILSEDTDITKMNQSQGIDSMLWNVEFSHNGLTWTSMVERSHILPTSYWHDQANKCQKGHVKLARYGRYLDTTVAAGTWVWALYKNDDVVYKAQVMQEPLSWGQLTDKLLKSDRHNRHVVGPYLWVEWDGEDCWDVVPKCHTMIIPAGGGQDDDKPTVEELRRHAKESRTLVGSHQEVEPEKVMVESMRCMHRSLILESHRVLAYWDGTWREATTESEIPTLDVLKGHMDFSVTGKYYCIRWTDEDTVSLLPGCLLKFRSPP